MPTTSNIAPQKVYIKSHLLGTTAWYGTILRDIGTYPLDAGGQAAFEAAVKDGTFTITAQNGGTVPSGTAPTLTIPDAPASIGAFEQKIQAEGTENVTGTGVAGTAGVVADGNKIGPIGTTAQYRTFSFNIPKTATNYAATLRYGSNTTAPGGTYSVIVNDGSPVDYAAADAVDGGYRDTVFPSLSLTQGVNTIRIQGKSGNPIYLDYMVLSRPAD